MKAPFNYLHVAKVNYRLWLGFFLSSVGLFSCKDDCKTTYTYKSYEPVYMLRDELRNAVATQAAKTLVNPGKIYAKGDYIFVNEIDKGIHIIDNSHPTAPQLISFINIPGNKDIAVHNNTLYADSYIDLLALDISNPQNISVLKRLENVFPSYGYENSASILVDYKEKWVTQEMEGDCRTNAQYQRSMMEDSKALLNNSSPANGTVASGKPGIGGSMARFTLYDHYLYTVSQSDLQLFDITAPTNPQKGIKINLGNWNIETIFPYQDKLFIGSQSGMHIYDNQDPAQPELLSTYEHIRSCDPVVVDDKYAYVTLRSGTACQGFTNQLEVIDISNLKAPTLVKTYPMQHPHGLGVDNSTLFLCEGEFGLKVFNAQNVHSIDQHLLAHFKDKDAYDVIPLGKLLLVIGKDGLYQYDYSDTKKVKLLSVIPVTRP
ncbi:MAG: hypothetical protein V4714_08520 [Bacteroidota bacterium]